MSGGLDTWLSSVSLLLIGSLFAFVATAYWNNKTSRRDMAKSRDDEYKKTKSRLVELEQKLALVTQAVVPLNMAMQAMLIKELTHYHTPEMDALLVKLGPPNILTDTEANRLEVMLQERTVDMGTLVSAEERDAAFILPVIIKRARVEQETLADAEAIRLRLVTVAAVVNTPVVVVVDTKTEGE